MNHHTIQYPPGNFYSDKYKDAGKDNTVYKFIVILLPIVIGIVLLMVFNAISLFLGCGILFEMIILGAANNYIHDAFHIRKSLIHKIPGFEEWKRLHIIHHHKMNSNFGIFLFLWDRMFKTFRKN